MDKRFTDIVQLIKQSRTNAIRAVNAELINLYWQIGEYLSKKIEKAEWGDSVVSELAKYIQKNEPEIKGFSDKNLWRMKQFYSTYKDSPKLSTLLREISWSHNLAIISGCKSLEEREFYLHLVRKERYSFRELERQISASQYERSMLDKPKLSTVLRERKVELTNTFKDSYVFDFLNIAEPHTEKDLQSRLVKQMKSFILELGKDFLKNREKHYTQN